MKWLLCFVLFLSFSALAQGEFRLFKKGMTHGSLNYSRDVYVYLPDGYHHQNQSYPVLYMQDGQNLFDPMRAYLGQTWNALATLNELIAKKLIAPVIVVAIDNTPARMDEYIPEKNGDAYLDFIMHGLRPQIDQHYRTMKGPRHTGIMGSSLGGLISLYAGIRESNVFGLVGALSPSIWWNERSILDQYQSSRDLPIKVYLDSGSIGGEKPEDVLALTHLLAARGFRHTHNLLVYIQDGADHREYYWAQRFPVALKFLFPPSP